MGQGKAPAECLPLSSDMESDVVVVGPNMDESGGIVALGICLIAFCVRGSTPLDPVTGQSPGTEIVSSVGEWPIVLASHRQRGGLDQRRVV
jgi:hypothetical protein